MTNGGETLEPAPRYMVTIFLTAGEEMQPFGRTRDLSATGAFVETPERPPLGQLRELAIVWGVDTLICQAKVARHAPDGIGVTFVNPPEAFQKAVAEILQTAPLKNRQPP